MLSASSRFLHVLLLLSCTLYMQAKSNDKSRSDTFNTADGSYCTVFDLRTGETTVALATACVCKDSNGRAQSYGCRYTAELYTCDEFVNNSKEIFDGLIETISGNY